MYWTDIVSAISAGIAAIAGIAVALVTSRKFLKSKEFEYEAARPYVIPSYEVENLRGEKHLYLVLSNVGDVPAKNVRLKFTSVGAWNWVHNPDYPFDVSAGASGVSAIGPNSSVKYFVGVIREGNPLEDLSTREVCGVSICDSPGGSVPIEDNFRLSLQDGRYRAK